MHLKATDSVKANDTSNLDQEIQELLQRIGDLEHKLKSEKANAIDLETKLV